jgi:arylsulfatase A-like enzyme
MVRIPLILKLPNGNPAGRRVEAIARTIDVVETVLDVLGLPPMEQSQGASLRPLWTAGSEPERLALSEASAWGFEKKAVRTGRYKYIVTIDEPTVRARGRQFIPAQPQDRELYDLLDDPSERRNLLEDPGNPRALTTAAELDAALRRMVPKQLGRTERAHLDAETVEKLKALGYLE